MATQATKATTSKASKGAAAKKAAPAIIFFDEIDAVAVERSK